jgi:hypothetical protein
MDLFDFWHLLLKVLSSGVSTTIDILSGAVEETELPDFLNVIIAGPPARIREEKYFLAKLGKPIHDFESPIDDLSAPPEDSIAVKKENVIIFGQFNHSS